VSLLDIRNQLIEVRTDLDASINRLTQLLAAEPAEDQVGPKLVWGAKVSADFRASVRWIEKELGLNANYLMACMAFETGVTFSPSKRNPASSASGLIQFMRATAIGLGTTVEALRQMTAVRQLAYVYKYFKAFGKDLSGWDLADTYMAILLPSMIGKPLDAPMNWSSGAYQVNKGLDADRSGVVTKREAYEKVRAMFVLGSQPENMA
jgi:hypothetical protein